MKFFPVKHGATVIVLLFGYVTVKSAPALPDLTVSAPDAHPHVVYRTYATDDCTVREGCVQAGTRRLLVFTTVTRNIGTADLVLGDPSTNAAFYYDPCHNHYHYTGFAEYRLRHEDGTLVIIGRKIGFCLEDILRWDSNAGANRRYDCFYQGIQQGWADVYSEDTPCNWIDITGLPGGNYLLEMEINPAGRLPELDFSNNIATIPVSFSDDCGATPANDDFSSAQPIAQSPISFRTYNACASKEAGEPNHAGNAGGHSLWYRGTAAANSVVEVSTEGSDFDTLLAVYTGTSVNTLTLVASNDDIGPGQRVSRVYFNAIGGTEYKIAVDGYGGAFGTVVLSINPPVNDQFTNCNIIAGGNGHTNGYNIGATKELSEPDHSGNIGGHSVWYCWTAPSSGAVSFDTIGSDFDTTLGVYTGGAVDTLSLVASDNDSGGNFSSRLAFNAVAGSVYHVAVDGVSGATGNLALNWGLVVRLAVRKVSGGSMELTLSGGQGSYRIQASPDFVQWNDLATVTLSGSAQQYSDNTIGGDAQRFYRAVPSSR